MENETGRPLLRPAYILGAIVLICFLIAFHLRFVQDDAFISFRYAENLAHGNGLVWNPGEHVDGYTNFLWTVLLAVPFLLHVSPITFSYVVGLLCFVLSLVLLYGVARRLLSPVGALLAVLLAGLNYSFAIYATGGLETPLVTALLMLSLYLTAPLLLGDPVNTWDLVAVSLVNVAALLTRLDSAVFVFVLQGALVLRLVWRRTGWRDLVALLLPGLSIFFAWCIWQTHYYGTLLPNTFYLKIGAAAASVRYVNGAHFLEQFFLKYLFFFLFFFLPLRWRKILHNPALLTLVTLAMAWCGYVIYAGGDFMEYRFCVALIPVLSLLLVWSTLKTMRWHLGPVALGLALLAAVAPITRVALFPSYIDVETREQLIAHLQAPNQDWSGIGQRLGALFHGQQVMLAVEPAGAIPFYSGLPAIDMLGLNDAWIARNGRNYLPVAGHYRIAPLSYLLEKGVVLLLQNATIVRHSDAMRPQYMAAEVLHIAICDGRCTLPPTAKMLRIPLDADRDLQVIYATPNPVVDRAIEEHHWPTRPIVN